MLCHDTFNSSQAHTRGGGVGEFTPPPPPLDPKNVFWGCGFWRVTQTPPPPLPLGSEYLFSPLLLLFFFFFFFFGGGGLVREVGDVQSRSSPPPPPAQRLFQAWRGKKCRSPPPPAHRLFQAWRGIDHGMHAMFNPPPPPPPPLKKSCAGTPLC